MRHSVSTVNVCSAVEYAVSASELVTIMTKSAVIKSIVTKSAVAVGIRMADESRTVEGRSARVSWVSATAPATSAPATSVIAALRRDDANEDRQSC